MSEPNSIVGTAGDALVVDNDFEMQDGEMRLVVNRTPIFGATHIFLHNVKTDTTFHIPLDRAEAKFLGKFLLGER